MIAVGGALELAAAKDPDAVLAHQSPDTTLADAKTQFVEFFGHAWPAIAAQAAAMLFTDMRQDRHVTPLALRRRPLLPGPEPAVSHPHQAAQTAARQIATVIGNELKLHGF